MPSLLASNLKIRFMVTRCPSSCSTTAGAGGSVSDMMAINFRAGCAPETCYWTKTGQNHNMIEIYVHSEGL